MGHNAQAIVVYVGLARLPQPLVSSAASIAVELAVELCSRCIVAAHTNLPFPGLDRLLRELLVGKAVDTLDGRALLELEVRYSAPFTTALRAAVQAALRRAIDGVASGNGTPAEQVALS